MAKYRIVERKHNGKEWGYYVEEKFLGFIWIRVYGGSYYCIPTLQLCECYIKRRMRFDITRSKNPKEDTIICEY